ncbi:MAG TPA: phage tail protein [Clostridiales bacterium]|nr:MAG: phage tail protein [Clostridiales bacterium GWD2_32_59]HAN09363.1 phage tail protein [Clostridiales bacterium]
MSENKVVYGLQNVHIAFRDYTEVGTQPIWKTPVAIAGAVKFSPQAQGDSNTFYADNSAYFVVTANNGYQAELEMALIPDAILQEMMGWSVDDNGMLVEEADATPKEFALLGQVQGDQKSRRFVYYSCTAQRPSKEHNTKGENLDPATDTLSLTIVPVDIAGKKITKGTLELNATNATTYNAFFNSVYKPIFE